MLIREGVDTIKLNVSGNQTIPNARSHITVMHADELATAVRTAHAHGKRVAAHVRAAAAIKMALEHGVDILYHCEYADEECLDLMEAARDRIFVAPAIGLLHALMHEAEPWGISYRNAKDAGVVDQFEHAQKVFPGAAQARCASADRRRLRFPVDAPWHQRPRSRAFRAVLGLFRRRGARVARRAPARRRCCSRVRRASWREGFLADLLVVAGEPQNDVRVLQSGPSIKLIMKDGRIFKNLFDELH